MHFEVILNVLFHITCTYYYNNPLQVNAHKSIRPIFPKIPLMYARENYFCDDQRYGALWDAMEYTTACCSFLTLLLGSV